MVPILIKFLWKKSSSPPKPRRTHLIHQGEVYNLKEVFDAVNEKYFNAEVDLAITWSPRRITGARRYRRLGCFNPQKNLIRLNPILDDHEVPPYFIAFIVYHEMLHHLFPPFVARGKRQIHHISFRQQERKFVEYPSAKKWVKEVGSKKFFQG